MSEEEYERLRSVLVFKKNIILQGAPGVGKTYTAKRLAYSLIGEKMLIELRWFNFIKAIHMKILSWGLDLLILGLN